MSDVPYKYLPTTGATISIQFSDLGDSARRKQTFGGYINAWKAARVGDFLYVIPRGVTVAAITKALKSALAAHDRAVLTYPHGKSNTGATAMRIKLFGRAADDLDASRAAAAAAKTSRAAPATESEE
jgi:hypothetical protein